MDVQKLCDYYFKEQFLSSYKNDLSQIKKHILQQKDVFNIECYDLELQDIIKRKNDSNHLKDLGCEYTENGFKILLPLKEFWNDIKYYIPKTITKLEIPFELIRNEITFLRHFPNLKTLVINDYNTLTPKNLEKIYKNTNIKKILVNNVHVYNEFYKNNNFYLSKYPYFSLLYNDIVIKSKEKKIEKEEDKKSFYNPFDTLKIDTYDLNKSQLERIFELSGDKFKNEVVIKTSNDNEYLIKFADKKTIESIAIKSKDVMDVNKFYNYLTNKGYNINSICYDVINMDYINMDLSIYEDISKNTNLLFKYEDIRTSNYEEFKGLIESLKWYKGLIVNSNLSSVEKTMFAFDIMKTFSYNESKISKKDSREPHRVIETGNIVCVGYANMLEQILKGIDDNIKIGDFSISCYNQDGDFLGGHARSIVRLDDEKYNIHGIYALDATWDSVKEGAKDIVGDDYTALDLYRYFLIPSADYRNTFPYDTVPDIFKTEEEIEKENLNNVFKKNLSGIYNSIFNGSSVYKGETITEEEIRRYLDAKRPSLDVFNQMVYNVRVAQGYPHEDALKEVEKAYRINKILIDRMNNNGQDITFFEEQSKSK